MKHLFDDILSKLKKNQYLNLKNSFSSKRFLFFYVFLVVLISFLKLFIKDLCWFGLLSVEKCSMIKVNPRAGEYQVGIIGIYIFIFICFFLYVLISKHYFKDGKYTSLLDEIKFKVLPLLLLPIVSLLFTMFFRNYFYIPARNKTTENFEIDCCKGIIRKDLNEVLPIDYRQPFCERHKAEYLNGNKCMFQFKR